MRKIISGKLHRLTVRDILNAKDGDHGDGGGLLLRIRPGYSAWVYRFTSPTGKRREMGLGTAIRQNSELAGKGLTDARKAAAAARDLLAGGIDPIDHREGKREASKAEAESKKAEAKKEAQTLARVARAFHERVIEPSRTPKHAAQWINSLEQHVPAELWDAPIDTITAPALLDFFIAKRPELPETASRIVQRLKTIFADAEFRGYCAGNPADAAARRLKEARLPRERGSFQALDWHELPTFIKELRTRPGIAAQALEFAILTAARTGEVIGATWAEFDLQATLWTIPAERMKGGEAHQVYLSDRAVAIVKDMQKIGSDYVFPNVRDTREPLSNMAMLTLLRRMDAAKKTTVHGIARATFSTWANENSIARPDVIEAALAHREQDKVRKAYNRAGFAAERRALLATWTDYCDGKTPATNVLPFQRSA